MDMALDTAQVHQISALRYRLLGGPADLAPLRVLDRREFEWQGWRATCCVLGASHAIVLRRGKRCVTELLACSPGVASSRLVIDLTPDRDCQVETGACGLMARVQLRRFPVARGDGLVGAFEVEDRLDTAFPAGPSGVPITRIGWRLDGPVLTIETVHTYPDDNCGVRTHTEFRPVAAGGCGNGDRP